MTGSTNQLPSSKCNKPSYSNSNRFSMTPVIESQRRRARAYRKYPKTPFGSNSFRFALWQCFTVWLVRLIPLSPGTYPRKWVHCFGRNFESCKKTVHTRKWRKTVVAITTSHSRHIIRAGHSYPICDTLTKRHPSITCPHGISTFTIHPIRVWISLPTWVIQKSPVEHKSQEWHSDSHFRHF